MSQLQELAGTRTMIVLDSETLLRYLHDDREETFAAGVRMGYYQAEVAAKASAEEPYTKSQAAQALGFSEGTIDNMRRRGDLESYEYGGQVRIEKSEVERFKRTHANLYKKSYNAKK